TGIPAPMRVEDKIFIGLIYFQPQQQRQLYCKQLLHEDERPYFSEAQEQVIFQLGEQKITPAICYESLQEQHAERCHALGADVYLASVAKPQRGIQKATQHYPYIAKKFDFPVMMVNNIGPCDNFVGAGQSGVWSASGDCLLQMPANAEGLLIFDTRTAAVQCVEWTPLNFKKKLS
ncbi:MAG: nitrilase-related carbon-nitrogen hydrolase, partial [Bacteroidota bacterium]